MKRSFGFKSSIVSNRLYSDCNPVFEIEVSMNCFENIRYEKSLKRRYIALKYPLIIDYL